MTDHTATNETPAIEAAGWKVQRLPQPDVADPVLAMSGSITEIAEAIGQLQGEMPLAGKSAENKYFGSNYAGLDSVWETAKPYLLKNKLTVFQFPSTTTTLAEGSEAPTGPPRSSGGRDSDKDKSGAWPRFYTTVTLTTRIIHWPSGEWIQATLTAVLPEHVSTVQGIGSAISYLRRYTLGPLVGIVSGNEDDDGNHASQRRPERQESDRGGQGNRQQGQQGQRRQGPPRDEDDPDRARRRAENERKRQEAMQSRAGGGNASGGQQEAQDGQPETPVGETEDQIKERAAAAYSVLAAPDVERFQQYAEEIDHAADEKALIGFRSALEATEGKTPERIQADKHIYAALRPKFIDRVHALRKKNKPAKEGPSNAEG